jgi:hypothetical protein
MRIRYFGTFAKPERVAVLRHFRRKRYGGLGVATTLGIYARDICRKKGYQNLYFHAYSHLESFYRKVSGGVAEPIEGAEMYYGDDPTPVIPMVAKYPPCPDAIDMAGDHYVIARQEGAWDVPSVHERRSNGGAQ